MKITMGKTLTKLCHAKPSEVVMLIGADLTVDDEPFLVCAVPQSGKRAARAAMTHGLYDDERNLFLVSLRSGLLRAMPHLSSRVVIFREADLHLGEESPAGALDRLNVRTSQEKA